VSEQNPHDEGDPGELGRSDAVLGEVYTTTPTPSADAPVTHIPDFQAPHRHNGVAKPPVEVLRGTEIVNREDR
jgi:hypothetical protein